MKKILLGLLLIFLYHTTNAQSTNKSLLLKDSSGNKSLFKKGNFYLRPSFLVNKNFTRKKSDQESLLGFNISSGIFVRRNLSAGLEISSTTREKEVRNVSELQTSGLITYNLGKQTYLKTSYGFSLNHISKIKGDLYLDLGAFIHTLSGKSIEKGSMVDQNNIPLGIDYKKTIEILYQTSIGFNTSLIFLINDHIGIHFNILQVRRDSEKYNSSELIIQFPSYIGIIMKT
jgi:hypothetical protein